MLLKRLTAIAAVFFFMTAFSSLAYADVDPNTAIQTAENSGIQASNLNGDSLQYIPSPQELQIMPGFYFGYLAYGSPFDPNSSGIDRYMGFNYYGEDMDNIAFPPDLLPDGENFEEEQWVYQPWQDPDIRSEFGVINTPEWDGNSQYQYYINAGIFYLNCTTGVGGIGSSTGYTITDWDGNSLWANLYQYVHILMPL